MRRLKTGPAREDRARRQERRDDRQEGARNVGMTDKRRAAIGETTTSCYALRFLRRFATGILEIGSRSERNVATIDKRGARNVGMTDKRRAAIGETTTSCYALRFLRRFATGILEIGSRSERNVATIDKRGARNVGMTDKRRAAIGEATTSCYALRFLRRFATGILEIGSRSERNVATIDKRGARNVGMTDKRRAAIGETTTSCYALRFLRRFATGILEIGSRSERNVATIDKRARGTSGRSARGARRPRLGSRRSWIHSG